MGQIDRIEMIQDYMDIIIKRHTIPDYLAAAYIHLFTVSQYCSILALKRGLNVELATISGLMHDIYSYQIAYSPKHAQLGAEMAKRVLEAKKLFSKEEIEIITHAIYYHSDKELVHGPYDEILKDADVLAHCLFNPNKEVASHEVDRFQKLKIELGLGE